jgi:hypothetical protein
VEKGEKRQREIQSIQLGYIEPTADDGIVVAIEERFLLWLSLQQTELLLLATDNTLQLKFLLFQISIVVGTGRIISLPPEMILV